MKKYQVYAVGNALVDIEYHTSAKKLSELGIEKGLMTLIDEQQQNSLIKHFGDSHEKMACGGSAANTIIALAQMGARVHFDCRVANDSSGQFYLQDLQDSGVHGRQQLDDAHLGVTGKCLVFVTPDADRTMTTFLGASADLGLPDLDTQALKQSEFVYIEGYLVSAEATRQATIEVRQLAERNGIKTAMTLSDPNMVTFFREGIVEMLGEGVDLLFANQDEAFELVQSEDLQETVQGLKHYARSFVITRGSQGALVFDGERQFDIAPHQVEAIDTLGAGDLFAGAFLFGLGEGMNYQQAGDLASLASSRIVTQFGPRLSSRQTRDLLTTFKAGI